MGPDTEWVLFLRLQKTGSTSFAQHLSHTLHSTMGWGKERSVGFTQLECQSCSYLGYAWKGIRPCSERRQCFVNGSCSQRPWPRLLVDNVPHLTLGDAAALLPVPIHSPQVVVVTWLRHPFTRVESEFTHTSGTPGWDYDGAYNVSACGELTFNNWLRCETTSRGASNRQTRMLSGDADSCAAPTHKSLAAAKRTLAKVVAWFGLFECPQLSLCLLAHQLFAGAARVPTLPEANKLHGTTWASVAEHITPEALVALRERNDLDLELVHFARDLLVTRAKGTACASEGCLLR